MKKIAKVEMALVCGGKATKSSSKSEKKKTQPTTFFKVEIGGVTAG
ncbi:MAG: hypothetical protein MJZ15_05300 [Bacteroidales bacterium]|nr:hypothetical protein [Bacteroidales bacterium]